MERLLEDGLLMLADMPRLQWCVGCRRTRPRTTARQANGEQCGSGPSQGRGELQDTGNGPARRPWPGGRACRSGEDGTVAGGSPRQRGAGAPGEADPGGPEARSVDRIALRQLAGEHSSVPARHGSGVGLGGCVSCEMTRGASLRWRRSYGADRGFFGFRRAGGSLNCLRALRLARSACHSARWLRSGSSVSLVQTTSLPSGWISNRDTRSPQAAAALSARRILLWRNRQIVPP